MIKLARHDDPSTSVEAGAGQRRLTEKQQDVLSFIRAAGERGVTDHDLARRFRGWTESTARKRRCELVDMRLVACTGNRVTITTGSKAQLWAVAELVPTPVVPPPEKRRRRAVRGADA